MYDTSVFERLLFLSANIICDADILCRPFAPEAESNISKYSRLKIQKKGMKNWIATLDNLHREGREDSMRHSELWDKMIKYFPERQRDEVILPSWIPRLSVAPFEMYHQAGVPIQKLGRKNADPLVATPGHSRNYDAAQSTILDEQSLRFKKRRAQVSMKRRTLYRILSYSNFKTRLLTMMHKAACPLYVC